MYYIALLLLTGMLIWVSTVHGPRSAIAFGLAAALLLPTWMYREVSSVMFDLRTVACALVVGMAMLHPGTGLRFRWVLADLLLTCVVIAQIAAEYHAGDLAPSAFLNVAVEWVLPYVVGRMAIRARDDVPRLTQAIGVACVGLFVWVALEAVSRVNPVGYPLGHYGSMQAQLDIRWGLRRAEGPLRHPIFMGMMLVLILPFAIQAAVAAKDKAGAWLQRSLPWLTGAGIFLTMSRGPMIGMAIALYWTALFRRPTWRKPMVIGAVLCGLLMAVNRESIMSALHYWSAERPSDEMELLVDGQETTYTGTNHRLLQFRVYDDAMANAGPFGYGRERTSGSPMKIPHIEEHLLWTFRSIDNHYMVMVLRSGFVGVSAFVLLGTCGLAYLIKPASSPAHPNALFAATLSGAILGVMLMLSSVWMAPDMGFCWLAAVGMAGSLRSLDLDESVVSRRAFSRVRPQTRRVQTRLPQPVPVA